MRSGLGSPRVPLPRTLGRRNAEVLSSAPACAVQGAHGSSGVRRDARQDTRIKRSDAALEEAQSSSGAQEGDEMSDERTGLKLKYALALAKRGLYIAPLSPDSKIPYAGESWSAMRSRD